MTNLINACFTRIFRSRLFYLCLVATALLAAAAVFFNTDANMSVVLTFPLFAEPMIMGAFIGLIIYPEFTHGTIRNKIIIGHKRSDIYLAFTICFSAIALLFFAVHMLVGFPLGMALLEDTSMAAKPTINALITILFLLVSNTTLSVLICMTVHDAKSVALVLVFQYALTFIGILPDLLEDNKVLGYVSKIIPQGNVYTLNVLKMPEKPWIAYVGTIILGILVTLLGISSFKSSDMK